MSDNQHLNQVPSPTPAPKTPGASVIGWILICFSVIPLVTGAKDGSQVTLGAGIGLAAVGIVCAIIGRLSRGKRQAT